MKNVGAPWLSRSLVSGNLRQILRIRRSVRSRSSDPALGSFPTCGIDPNNGSHCPRRVVPGLFCPLEVEGSARPFTIDRVSGVRVSGVSELVLEVSDLAEAERFYVDVLG